MRHTHRDDLGGSVMGIGINVNQSEDGFPPSFAILLRL